jgi:hypothetical protein
LTKPPRRPFFRKEIDIMVYFTIYTRWRWWEPFLPFAILRLLPCPSLSQLRRSPMMWERKAPLCGLLTVRCLAEAAHGCGRPDRCTLAWAGLALVGLVVGILVLVLQGAPIVRTLPDAPSRVACAATRLPLIMTLKSGSPLALSRTGECPAAVVAWHMPLPSESLALGDDDLDNDSPLSLTMLIAGDLSLPLVPALRGINGLQYAYLWLSPYLIRPQLLTRL